MPRSPRWKESSISDGVGEYELFSWKYFHDFVYQEMLDYGHYIWRGQRCTDWPLEPSLDRALRGKPGPARKRLRRVHLESFKYAVRGRRGPYSAPMPSENDWWALGQHHGLHSPLLDWTRSPFAAAYFAFIGRGSKQTPRRALYALSPTAIERKSKLVAGATPDGQKPEIVELVRPFSDDNPRLVNQAGLFTRAPDDIDLEAWVRAQFGGLNNEYVLIKVTVPNADREMCLRSLNRMNINHLTLFPDIMGASLFCNLDLEIDRY